MGRKFPDPPEVRLGGHACLVQPGRRRTAQVRNLIVGHGSAWGRCSLQTSYFSEAYRGVPPWDIGRPQPEFVKLAEKEDLGRDIIDVGCGTGEHAILFASKGYRVLGVDSAPLAIEKARAKASQRGSKAEFLVADALRLAELSRRFDAALDSGLFHVFSDSDRASYVESLRSVLRPQGRYYMLCFSDREPVGWGGPRRIFKREILKSFSDGWRVDYVHPARFESAFHRGGGEAWFSKITRAQAHGHAADNKS